MAREKQTRRMIAMALAAAVAMSSMPVVAFAEGDVVEGQTQEQSTDTPQSTSEDNKVSSENNVPKAPAEGEAPVVKDGPIDVTIKIPSTPDNPETSDVDEGYHKETATFGPEVGTATGDLPEGPDDKEYDYEVVTQQGKVTVESEVENIETEYGEDDLDYIHSETKPTEDNDLYQTGDAAPEQFLPGYEEPADEEPVEGEDGYDFASGDKYNFEYVGTGNTSQFRPAVVFTEPLTDEQKIEQYGDDPRHGAYIYYGENGKSPKGENCYTSTFVSWLDEEYRDTVAKTEDGKYVTDEAGYILDIYGNRVLKKEKTMVGPDGKTYYLHRFDNNGGGNYVEGWYMDGEWEKELNAGAELDAKGNPIAPKVPLVDKDGNPVLDNDGNPVMVNVTSAFVQVKDADGKDIYVRNEKGEIVTSYGAVWAGAQQFVLVDKATGEVITTYCADITTRTEMGFGYNIVNLEDSTYYSDEQAELIRAIAKNGYWGTESGLGSLDAMKEMLSGVVDNDGNRVFNDEELATLTDGMALTATQMAIWSCSNHMAGTEFINTHYGSGNVPGEKEDEAKLMFKIYEYLKNLAPVSYEGKETTADTIINAQNFLKGDMEITVLEKADSYEVEQEDGTVVDVNKDDKNDNDAYKANLTFALVVTPSTENGDELVVKVLSGDKIVATGCIAGENQNMYADDNGNYTFKDIIITEGEHEFNITMEGVQNLKEGVYLYTSEVELGNDPNQTYDDTTSQTMVGMAKGEHEVKVSQKVKLKLEVEDEKVVVRERRGGGGGNTPPTPPTPITDIPEEEPPLTNIPEEEPPLSDIPDEEVPLVAGAEDVKEPMVLGEEEIIAETGDSNHMTTGFGGMLVALAGMFMLRRKKEQ